MQPEPKKTAVDAAALWLATTPLTNRPHPLIPHMRREFGLSAMQAVEAIREANLIRARST